MKIPEPTIQWKSKPGQRLTLKNTWPRWILHLNLRYSHVMLISGYLVLTAVNWSWNRSPISNCKYVSCMHKLTQVDLYIFFGRHLAQLSRLTNILRDYMWAHDMVMWHGSAGFLVWQLSIDMDIQCHLADVNPYVTLCLPSLHGWSRHKSTANLWQVSLNLILLFFLCKNLT